MKRISTIGLLAAASLFGATAVVEAQMAQPETFSVQIATGNDDAEESVASGGINFTSSDLELNNEGGSNPQVIGMRFLGIAIPAGAVIESAQLVFTVDEDDNGRILEVVTSKPWELDPLPAESLYASEFVIKFYTHACAEIRCGPNTLFTDPWLVGPALVRGWWLSHQPPFDWLDRLAAADAIYISHNHSDHLNLPTLKILVKKFSSKLLS